MFREVFDAVADPEKNLLWGVIGAGVGTAIETAKFGYGYVTDPQNRANTAENASRFVNNFGRYTPNGREFILNDPLPYFGESGRILRQNIEIQNQQLQDAKSRGSIGFDDEEDNAYDDRVRFQSENSAILNRQQRSQEMATPKTTSKTNSKTGSTTINSNRPSDYGSPTNKLLSDYENFNQRSRTQMFDSQLQSRDRRYGIETNAKVTSQNNQLQSGDRRYGVDVNAGTQRYGIDVNAGVDRELGYAKTFAELQASLNRNQLNSGDNRFETTTKYGTQERMNAYNRNTIDQTDLAKAMVQAGTYGRSQSEINSLNADKYNRQVAADYDSKMMNYAKYQNELSNMSRSIGNAERAYNDQRTDSGNARRQATMRYNQEQAQMRADRDYDRGVAARERDMMRQEKSNSVNMANRLQQQSNMYRAQELEYRRQQVDSDVELNRAKTAQIYSDTALRNNQFAAGRADIGYNRGQQGRFSLAF